MKNNKPYKKSKNTSHHSVRRGKQRAGLSKTETQMMAARAFSDGIDAKCTRGELRDKLICHYGKIKYYANKIFVYGTQNTLVTIMNIDPIYEKELYKYVDYPTFVWYKNNRYKYKQNGKEVAEEIKYAKQLVTTEINEFLKPIGYKVLDIKVHKKLGYVYIDPWKFNEITTEFKKAFTNKFNMTLEKYVERKASVTKVDARILNDEENKWGFVRRWFMTRLNLTIKFDYFNNNILIIRPTTTHSKEEIKPEVIKLFENTFKYKIYVREKYDGCGENVLNPEQVELAFTLRDWFTNKGYTFTLDDIFDEAVVITTDMIVSNEDIEEFKINFNRLLIIDKKKEEIIENESSDNTGCTS